jgi:hypothetical protein
MGLKLTTSATLPHSNPSQLLTFLIWKLAAWPRRRNLDHELLTSGLKLTIHPSIQDAVAVA